MRHDAPYIIMLSNYFLCVFWPRRHSRIICLCNLECYKRFIWIIVAHRSYFGDYLWTCFSRRPIARSVVTFYRSSVIFSRVVCYVIASDASCVSARTEFYFLFCFRRDFKNFTQCLVLTQLARITKKYIFNERTIQHTLVFGADLSRY